MFQVLEKAPKKFRYSLITRLENKSIGVAEALRAANVAKLGEAQRLDEQKQARLSLFVLGYEANLAIERGCLTLHQGEVAAKAIRDCVKLLAAWVCGDERRLAAR